MKFLRHDNDFFLPEDFLGSNDRVQGAKPGIIADYFVRRDSKLNERLFHIGWLVVRFDMVVAAHKEKFNFPGMIQLGGARDPILKK